MQRFKASCHDKMEIEFESDHKAKVLYVSFKDRVSLNSPEALKEFRRQWTDALKSWHSPYKACLDLSNVELQEPMALDVKKALELMFRYLSGLFLKSTIAFGQSRLDLPFTCVASREEALNLLGLRPQLNSDKSDFRSLISLQNHFQTHCVELSFTQPVVLASSDQLKILKSKLTNNLMQWHSKWNLLIDCTHLQIEPSLDEGWNKLESYFRGFFMKKILGYSPANSKAEYPFQIFRSRHRAAAALEAEGFSAGDTAQCRTKKPF